MPGRSSLLLLFALLLPSGAISDEISEQFWAAARHGDVGTVQALLAKGVDVNTRFPSETTALLSAAEKGHVEVVKVLLEHGADVNARDVWGMTAMRWAMERGHLKVIETLLAKSSVGADQALLQAVGDGRVEIIKLLLAKSKPQPAALTAALTAATSTGRSEIAELLKKAGVELSPKRAYPLDSQTLDTYAGVYKSRDGLELSFTVKLGTLTGGNIFEDESTWEPINKLTFRPTYDN